MKKSGVFQRKIYFVIIQDDIWLCYAEDVESVSFRFAGKLMLPGVFQDRQRQLSRLGRLVELSWVSASIGSRMANWKALTWQEPDGSTERM